jgi:hypothetical protein
MARNEKRPRYTRDQIDALLDEFDRSGLTQVAFARHLGLSLSTFRWWLRRRQRSGARPRFLPVTVANSLLACSTGIELELGADRRVHIPVDIDREALRALLPIVIAAC